MIGSYFKKSATPKMVFVAMPTYKVPMRPYDQERDDPKGQITTAKAYLESHGYTVIPPDICSDPL